MVSNTVRAAAIRALETANGRVTAEDLVQASRAADHPLHDDGFRWDDEAGAAHQFRLANARRIIASVRLEVRISETKVITTVSYVRDPEAGSNAGYVSVARIRSERENCVRVMLAEIERVLSSLERAQDVSRGLEFETQIDDLLERSISLTSDLRDAVNAEEGADA